MDYTASSSLVFPPHQTPCLDVHHPPPHPPLPLNLYPHNPYPHPPPHPHPPPPYPPPGLALPWSLSPGGWQRRLLVMPSGQVVLPKGQSAPKGQSGWH